MKIGYALLTSMLLASVPSLAQKGELKTLAKIYEKDKISEKDIEQYQAAIAAGQPLIGGAAEADKIYFDYYKSAAPMLPLALPENQMNPMNAMRRGASTVIPDMAAGSAAALDDEKQSGKKVLSDDIDDMVKMFKPAMVSFAIALGNNSKNKEAASILYGVYKLDP